MEKNLGKSTLHMEPNLAAMLSYTLGLITGIVFYLIEKENKFVRFHAMQSIVVFGALLVLHILNTSILFFLPWVIHYMLSMVIGIGSFVLWILLMIKAYQKEDFKLPIAGDIAEKYM